MQIYDCRTPSLPTVIGEDDWSTFGSARLRERDGTIAYVLRLVRRTELDALWALHRLVCERLPRASLFRHDTREYMARNIDESGRTMGVFSGDRLLAYGAVSFCEDGANPGTDVGLPEAALPLVAAYDGSAVHPELRGSRLQQLVTQARHAIARARGKRHLLGTVAPENYVSLANFLACGNRVRNIRYKYGGMLRLIIHADLHGWPAAGAGSASAEVALADVPSLTRLLHAGYEGIDVVRAAGGARLRLTLPCGPAPAAMAPDGANGATGVAHG